MFRNTWSGSLLLGFWLMQVPVYAQSTRPIEADTVERTLPSASVSQNGPNLSRVVAQIVHATNAFRSQEGRRALTVNAELVRAAQYFADYMAQTDQYGHAADGHQPWERAAKHGYAYCLVLENIAYQYNSAGFTTRALAQGVVTSWQESPGHRRNLLDADVTETGVAVARSARTSRYYAVQLFGRPKSQEIVFRITNQTNSTISYAVDDKTFSLQPNYTVTHQSCRPPKLEVSWPNRSEASSQPKAEVLHPSAGDHFVMRRDAAGQYTVEKR